MIVDLPNSVYMYTRELAENYRDKGYETDTGAVLDFMPDFHPDLVVRKGGETKVIEVRTRGALAADRKIQDLVNAIDARPGWSFELVLVDELENLYTPPEAAPFEQENIVERVEQAEKALEAGFCEAAFMLAWSACEAAARMLLKIEGVSKEGITSASYVVNQARYLGLLSSEDYLRLRDMQGYRNAIAHGFSHDEIGKKQVVELLETARNLTSEISRN